MSRGQFAIWKENHLRHEISLAKKCGKPFVAELEEDAGSSLLTAAVLLEANRNGNNREGSLGLMMLCELQRQVWSLFTAGQNWSIGRRLTNGFAQLREQLLRHYLELYRQWL